MNRIFYTKVFLLNLLIKRPKLLTTFELNTLDKLTKKIDVVKIVYAEYSSDLSYALSENEISNNDYIILLKVLIFYAEYLHDLKFFNSALKLKDKLSSDLYQQVHKDFCALEQKILKGSSW